MDTNTLVNVYHALVYSYLRYGILIWGNASQAALKPLKVVVNRAIRIIGKLPFGNIELNPAYKQLKLLQVPKVHSLELGKFEYKSKNDLLPVSLGNYFEFSSELLPHSHNVQNAVRPIRFLCNSTTGEKSVQYQCFNLWKNLPHEIKSCESFNIFKKTYKKHLIEHDTSPDTSL